MAIEKVLELRGRIIRNDDDAFGYEFFSGTTGNTLFTSPEFFDDEEDARAELEALRARFIIAAADAGGTVKKAEDGWVDLYDDPENSTVLSNMFGMIENDINAESKLLRDNLGVQMRRLDESGGGRFNAQAINEETGGAYGIMGVLAISKETGKFGFAVLSSDGETLMRPKEWYDTPDEAYRASKTDPDVKELIARELKARGLSPAGYFDGGAGIEDVNMEEFTGAVDEIKNRILSKVDERPDTRGVRSLGGFRPNL